MKKGTKKADSRKVIGRRSVSQILAASIARTGKTADGREMAVLRFEDGVEGALSYEYVRTLSVEQGKENRTLLEKFGYKLWMSCVAGLFGSSTYEGPKGDFVEVSGTHMGRLRKCLSDGGGDLGIDAFLARQKA